MARAEPPAWYVISLRPQGGHGPMRRAAARHGAGVIPLSPWRLQRCDDAGARAALEAALVAPKVVFTSPEAVRAAAALQGFRARPGQHWLAVGAGTSRALARAGVDDVQVPHRMDSEGLLAMPALQSQALSGQSVGLVTAPDGRGLLAEALRGRGADVLRADVYRRLPLALSSAALARLRALKAPAWMALSSGGALQQVLASLPADLRARVLALPAAAASERLQGFAQAAGVARVVVAEGPAARQLVDAMVAASTSESTAGL